MIRIIQEILNRIRFMFQRLNRLLFVKKQIKEIRPLCWETGAAVFRLKSGHFAQECTALRKDSEKFFKMFGEVLAKCSKIV